MANKKAETTESTVEVKEEVKETKAATPEIDIDAIINKAVSETAKKYQSTIEEQADKIKELENKVAQASQNTSGFNSNKRVKIMYMGVGSANFSKGRINVNFEEPFATRDVRYDIFEEMYDMFGEWFRTFELVVLDKEVREYIGLEYPFKKQGADKETFEEMLTLPNYDCLVKIGKLQPMLAMTFLRFYIDEYLDHNPDTLAKFTDITTYYKDHYGIVELQNEIQEMLHQ
jgi:hypothetical protein